MTSIHRTVRALGHVRYTYVGAGKLLRHGFVRLRFPILIVCAFQFYIGNFVVLVLIFVMFFKLILALSLVKTISSSSSYSPSPATQSINPAQPTIPPAADSQFSIIHESNKFSATTQNTHFVLCPFPMSLISNEVLIIIRFRSPTLFTCILITLTYAPATET